MPIENTRQIVRELLVKTDSREIKWRNTFESSDKFVFKYTKKITEKKSLAFTLNSLRTRSHSDLTITFGPVGDNKFETLIKIITPTNQPLLYDLIDNLHKKFNSGDIPYLRESMSFDSDKDRSEKLKNLRLINQVTKDTESGKLTWENTFKDKQGATFTARVAITKLKHLVLFVKVTEESEIPEDNVLRVLMRVEKINGPDVSSSTSKIKTVTLNEYPALRILIGKLYKTYLGKEFKYPFEVKPKPPVLDTKGYKSVAVVAENLEDYRQYILSSIKGIIRELPNSPEWEDKFGEIYDCYEKIKKSTNMTEINQLLFKATEVAKKGNPIGTPRWAR